LECGLSLHLVTQEDVEKKRALIPTFMKKKFFSPRIVPEILSVKTIR